MQVEVWLKKILLFNKTLIVIEITFFSLIHVFFLSVI